MKLLLKIFSIFNTKSYESIPNDVSKDKSYPKRYIEEYTVDARVTVGRIIAEMKIQQSEPIYQ